MPVLFESPKRRAKPQHQNAAASPVQGTVRTPLSAFAIKPPDVRFETQEPEETVELFMRQHPIVNIPWLVVAVIMVFAPSVIFPFMAAFADVPFVVPTQYIIVATVFWYVATFGFILANFLHWFFNIYIVTNERIVDIDFRYLLYKHFAVAELTKIQDLSYEEKGILSTIFDYGNVMVQTAGEIPNVEFESVPHPEIVVEKVRALTERIEQKSL